MRRWIPCAVAFLLFPGEEVKQINPVEIPLPPHPAPPMGPERLREDIAEIGRLCRSLFQEPLGLRPAEDAKKNIHRHQGDRSARQGNKRLPHRWNPGEE